MLSRLFRAITVVFVDKFHRLNQIILEDTVAKVLTFCLH